MNVEEIMTRGVETVDPETTITDAARKMRDLNIGFLPVYAASQIMGVVTDRDIAIRAVAGGLDTLTATVSEIMTAEVVGCFQNQSIEAAAQLMNVNRIRRLIVVDDAKDLVGVVALGDLAIDALDDEEAGRVLQTISWPAKPDRVTEAGVES